MREKILLVGDSNVSKTFSLVKLAIQYPESNVVILDPDDGTAKVLAEWGMTNDDLPNLSIIPVTKDWAAMMVAYRLAKSALGEGDWLCMDMLGRFWDLAQGYYSAEVFGHSHAEHLLMLKKQAKSVAFSGFDGLQDWPLIKNIHNADLMDDAVLYSEFNVMCTTSVRDWLPVEKVPKTGQLGIYASEFGIKPEGEKHNIYRFDTQIVMFRKKDGAYWFRIARDRGRPFDVKKEFDITGKSFWEVYVEQQGV
ncbi:hypothetical protein LCGC14_2625670 [marine sediment metagenome]|uniref:AAA domain-containing protein n=1 Tax=marine sediment metagenome TaxID=412755 RepID=A0A0F9CU89_9ZZZZ